MATDMAVSSPALERFDPAKIQLIKDMCAPDATDAELEMFLYQARRTGLDPLLRQLYFFKQKKMKKNAKGQWEQDGWKAPTMITSIDGFRLIAERNEHYEGQDGPYWCGKDGVWKDVWIADEAPLAAKVGVYKRTWKAPLYGVARLTSYAAYKDGKLTDNWSRMPDVMLAKCAEALALRKAFPQDTSGLFTQDEMEQAGVTADYRRDSPKAEVREAAGGGPQPLTVVAPMLVETPVPATNDTTHTPKEFMATYTAMKGMVTPAFLTRCVQMVAQGTVARDWDPHQVGLECRLLDLVKRARFVNMSEDAIESFLNTGYDQLSGGQWNPVGALNILEHGIATVSKDILPDDLPF